jgi:hypothetical protein
VVYVGDGGNDGCPCTTLLREGDLALARGGFRLARELKAAKEEAAIDAEGVTSGVRCQVVEWADWRVLSDVLAAL